MSVAQLSPGDKLSLKGKIFELQKKLNILDIVQQNTEEYSFRPEITRYDLPDRHEDYIQNVSRAQEASKERMEAIKQNLKTEEEMTCTFRPTINRSRSRHSGDVESKSKPVFERLYEKGKEYNLAKEKRKKTFAKFDADGNRLFSPEISKSSQRLTLASNVPAQEFLYFDAKERKERLMIMTDVVEKQAQMDASRKKINKQSEKLLLQKAERQGREIYTLLVTHYGDGDLLQTLCMKHIVATIEHLLSLHYKQHKSTSDTRATCSCGILCSTDMSVHRPDPYRIAEEVWSVIDPHQTGSADIKQFLEAAIPVLSRSPGQLRGAAVVAEQHPAFSGFLRDTLRLVKEIKQSNAEGMKRDDASETSVQRRQRQKRIDQYNALLEAHEQKTQERMEELRVTLNNEEMKECTFRPQINNYPRYLLHQEEDEDAPAVSDASIAESASVMTGNTATSVYDRLYSLKDRVPRSIETQKHRPTADKELEGCTFTPDVPPPPPAIKRRLSHESASMPLRQHSISYDDSLEENSLGSIASSEPPQPQATSEEVQEQKTKRNPAPRGYQESIARLREAAERKQRKQEEDEKFFQLKEENYQRSRQLMQQGTKPFHFRTEERIAHKQQLRESAASYVSPVRSTQSPGGGRAVQLYVKVKLGKGNKDAQIGVAEGDNPAVLARDFCRIYALDASARDILTQVIANNMIENNIAMSTIDDSTTASQLRIDDGRDMVSMTGDSLLDSVGQILSDTNQSHAYSTSRYSSR